MNNDTAMCEGRSGCPLCQRCSRPLAIPGDRQTWVEPRAQRVRGYAEPDGVCVEIEDDPDASTIGPTVWVCHNYRRVIHGQ